MAVKEIEQDFSISCVDPWDTRWPAVLRLIERFKHRRLIGVDGDGWMSARHVVLVAFQGSDPVGYLCFEVAPIENSGGVLRRRGKPVLEAKVQAIGLTPAQRKTILTEALWKAARDHAGGLSCKQLAWENRVERIEG